MFKILTFVFIIVSLIAITKAVRYETQIKRSGDVLGHYSMILSRAVPKPKSSITS